jgi:hypothetical protein
MNYPLATQKILKINFNANGMKEYRGLVLHIQQGHQAGTIAWFNNPKAEASSKWACAKNGQLVQLVNDKDEAWTQMAGNPLWDAVECEGLSGEQLTSQQITTIARLFEWHSFVKGYPLELTSDPYGKGLGHHAMGGEAWGGHLDCPGRAIIKQKPVILAKAIAIRKLRKV